MPDHPPGPNNAAAAPGSRGWCVAEACRLEATAEKPGNVHPGASFPDLDHAELVAAGQAIAPAMDAAPRRPLGRTILRAVQASRRVTRSNANLGIVLAIAPLAAIPGEGPVVSADVWQVLGRLTTDDASDTWQAIAHAAPGGMGRREKWDLSAPAPTDLRAAMAEAASHDRIARLWTEGWQPLFDGLVADLVDEVAAGMTPGDAVVRGYLRQLAREPDSLVARRHGSDVAAAKAAGVAERPLRYGAAGGSGEAVARRRAECVGRRRAVAETGNAIVIGGLVLGVGFAAVTVSSVPALAGFGRLACAAVVAATIAELIFLPALLVVTDSFVRRYQAAWRDGIFGTEPLSWPAFGRGREPARTVA